MTNPETVFEITRRQAQLVHKLSQGWTITRGPDDKAWIYKGKQAPERVSPRTINGVIERGLIEGAGSPVVNYSMTYRGEALLRLLGEETLNGL